MSIIMILTMTDGKIVLEAHKKYIVPDAWGKLLVANECAAEYIGKNWEIKQ